MAEIKFSNIDLRDIPRSATNFTIVASDLALSAIKTAIAFRDVSKYTSDKDIADTTSMLGTPVYDSITLGNLSNRDENNYIDLDGSEKTFTPIRIHNAILDVNLVKNIITNKPTGANGTIKQYISKDDYSITLTGRVGGIYNTETGQWEKNSNRFPAEGVKSIVGICDVNSNIDVSSFFLQEIFGITKVVIVDYNFYQREGFRNEQMFTINMLSDRDTILEFTEEEAEDSESLKTLLGT